MTTDYESFKGLYAEFVRRGSGCLFLPFEFGGDESEKALSIANMMVTNVAISELTRVPFIPLPLDFSAIVGEAAKCGERVDISNGEWIARVVRANAPNIFDIPIPTRQQVTSKSMFNVEIDEPMPPGLAIPLTVTGTAWTPYRMSPDLTIESDDDFCSLLYGVFIAGYRACVSDMRKKATMGDSGNGV